MTAQEIQINLLPKDRWEVGLVGRLLKWALSVGRYVVIFTELVVILAFLFRFSLDRKLTDAKEEMQQKQAVVMSYGDFEKSFQKVQEQLKIIKDVRSAGMKVGSVLFGISQITPIDTVYESITIAESGVTLEGETLSEVGLATLLAKAQESEMFGEVTLDSVASVTQKNQAIKFKMTLLL